jgi:hypothetical protein
MHAQQAWALSSNPSTAKKDKPNPDYTHCITMFLYYDEVSKAG